MTPPHRHLLFAFAIILVGLSARALVDKGLALAGGGETVAWWAQLQSLVEMVVGVVGVGLGQGLTVLVAQQGVEDRQRALFGAAMRLGGWLAGGVIAAAVVLAVVFPGLAGAVFSPEAAVRADFARLAVLAALAALAGWLGVAGSLAAAYQLGRQRQDLVFWLALAGAAPLTLVALLAASIEALLLAQVCTGLVMTVAVWRWLRQHAPASERKWRWRQFLAGNTPGRPPCLSVPMGGNADRKAALGAVFASDAAHRALWRFVPVGVSIGLASPLSQILARGEVSAAMSWHDAGVMQAIWRAAEWVTAFVAGVLSLFYLPRFSRALEAPESAESPASPHSAESPPSPHSPASGARALRTALRRAAMPVLGVTALMLLLLWFNQTRVLSLLYDPRFVAAPLDVGLFLLGDWLRVASWIILFALLALRATWWVSIGEFFSLPLFAALIVVFADGMSLHRAGALYLATYAVYLAFNLIGLRAALRGWRA